MYTDATLANIDFSNILTKVKNSIKEILYGVHSGAPLCCALNYEFVKLTYGMPVAKKCWNAYYLDGKIDADYVVCPACYVRIKYGRLTPNHFHDCLSGKRALCYEVVDGAAVTKSAPPTITKNFRKPSLMSYFLDLIMNI